MAAARLHEVERAGLVGDAVADGEEGRAQVEGDAAEHCDDEVAAQPNEARRPAGRGRGVGGRAG